MTHLYICSLSFDVPTFHLTRLLFSSSLKTPLGQDPSLSPKVAWFQNHLKADDFQTSLSIPELSWYQSCISYLSKRKGLISPVDLLVSLCVPHLSTWHYHVSCWPSQKLFKAKVRSCHCSSKFSMVFHHTWKAKSTFFLKGCHMLPLSFWSFHAIYICLFIVLQIPPVYLQTSGPGHLFCLLEIVNPKISI